MRHYVGASVLLLLAGCDRVGIQRARQADLVGEWGRVDGDNGFPQSCGTYLSLRYNPNGSYYRPGEIGAWRLRGDALSELTVSFLEIHDEETASLIGKTHVLTIQWVDQDRFLKHFPDGEVWEFRRCPYWG